MRRKQLILILIYSYSRAYGQGIPDITGNAGDLLWESDEIGGRVATFHRGYLLTHSHTVGSATVLDLMPLETGNPPTIISEYEGASNGHAWIKFGDAYRRGYSMPEFNDVQFVDLSDMTNITAFSGSLQYDYSNAVDNDRLGTYPYAYYSWNDQLKDVRSNVLYENTPDLRAGLGLGGEIMIGNLLFSLPLGPVDGLTIWDTSDPSNVRLLSLLTNPLSNYPDGWSVYKNYIILTTGDDSNEGGNNMVAIDFSDPSSPFVAFGFNVSEIGPARYSVFQDNYGFVANGNQWHKINMDDQTVEHFTSPGSVNLGDFWPMAMGNIVSFIEGQTFGDRIALFLHDTDPDIQGPSVGYHVPNDGQTGYSRFSGIGFVINECLAGETVNSSNIVVTRCSDNTAISGAVAHTSYGSVQWIPDNILQENTTYNVSITSGLQDCAGNGAQPYSFTFSTGSSTACDNGSGDVNHPPIINSFSVSVVEASLNEEIAFEVDASDTDNDPLEYRWNFDNGTIIDWSDQSSVTASYDESGNYRVVVQVRDAQATTSDFIVINISEAASGTPLHSSPIILDEDNRMAWVVNPDNHSISYLDIDQLTLQGEYTVGQDPTSLALDDAGNVWIACRDQDELWIVNAQTGNVIDRISTGRGSRPFGIIKDPIRSYMYVSEFGSGYISRVSQDRTSLEEVYVGPTPRALAIHPSGDQLSVSRMISGEDHGAIYTLNLSSFEAGPTIALRIDETSPPTSGVAGPGIPNYIAGLAYSPSGVLSYVSKKDNIFNGTHAARNGVSFTFERTVRSIIGRIEDNSEITSDRMDVDDMAQPSSITYSPNGNATVVTMQGNNLVLVMDANSGSEIAREITGLAPQGAVIDPLTGYLFTKNFMGRSVSVFDASSALNGTASSMPALATIVTVSTEILNSEVLQGKRIFYNADDPRMTQQGDSDNGYISCATCHLDGTHDGIIWDFTQRGEGLRNTTSLRGRGAGHGRMHWSGNFDEFQDFEHDIRNEFGGSGFITDTDFETGTVNTTLGDPKNGISNDLDALAAYLESLTTFDPSPYKPSNTEFTEEALRGRTLFRELNCENCHSGNAFTNSSQGLIANVGTITERSGDRLGSTLLGLDVPTLKDVWSTAPYLHDGSASSLTSVMDRHIGFESLNAGERNDLLSYLLQLDDTESAICEGISLSIATPQPNSMVNPNAQVYLSIETNLEEDEVDLVSYYANGETIATSRNSPFDVLWSPDREGAFDIQVIVTLNNGTSIGTIDKQTMITADESIPLSVADESDVAVYPIPAQDILNIVGSFGIGTEIEIHDLSGKKIHQEVTVNDARHSLSLEKFNPGIYVLKVGSYKSLKFIIQ